MIICFGQSVIESVSFGRYLWHASGACNLVRSFIHSSQACGLAFCRLCHADIDLTDDLMMYAFHSAPFRLGSPFVAALTELLFHVGLELAEQLVGLLRHYSSIFLQRSMLTWRCLREHVLIACASWHSAYTQALHIFLKKKNNIYIYIYVYIYIYIYIFSYELFHRS